MRLRAAVALAFGIIFGLLVRLLQEPLGGPIIGGTLLAFGIYIVADLLRPAPAGPRPRTAADLVTFLGGVGVGLAGLGLLAIVAPQIRGWLGLLALILLPLYAALRVVLERRART